MEGSSRTHVTTPPPAPGPWGRRSSCPRWGSIPSRRCWTAGRGAERRTGRICPPPRTGGCGWKERLLRTLTCTQSDLRRLKNNIKAKSTQLLIFLSSDPVSIYKLCECQALPIKMFNFYPQGKKYLTCNISLLLNFNLHHQHLIEFPIYF